MLSRTVLRSDNTSFEGTSTSTLALPPEIWLLICPYLKSAELQSISSTCSTFRYLAQPLLFSTLDVSPFLLSYNAELPILRPQNYLTRLVKRLKYYTLPHIVHGVRHCWVSPYSRIGFPVRNHQDDLDPNLIINAVVEALHHFPNLSTLSWHCIDITPEWWNVIQSLRITNLWLNSSTIRQSVSSPLPCIVNLDLDQWPWEGRVTNLVSIHEERFHGVDSLTLQHIITPDAIQSLSVPRSDTASHLFSVLCQTTHSLRSLKVPFAAINDRNFMPALENCPHLASLCIFSPSSDERSWDVKIDNLSPSALPSLIAYEGPYTHILQFAQHPRALERISLWGFDGRPAICSSDTLVDTLVELAGTTTVNSLKYINLTVDIITFALLEALSSFSLLECIVIQSQDSFPRDTPFHHSFKTGSSVTSLYDLMDKASFPPNIKQLKLSTRLINDPKLNLNEQEREVATFMESFGSHHPTMQRMEIGYGIYWTGMYSVVWGRIRENSEVFSSESRDLGPVSRKNVEGGYSSRTSSKDCILSTVVSTVHPMPLGKLTFTEHRRTILFTHNSALVDKVDQEFPGVSRQRIWNILWMRLRRWWSLA